MSISTDCSSNGRAAYDVDGKKYVVQTDHTSTHIAEL